MSRREPQAFAPMPPDLELSEVAPSEPARIGNPFARFQTRAHWLGAIIRRSRAAEAERSKPDWFNR